MAWYLFLVETLLCGIIIILDIKWNNGYVLFSSFHEIGLKQNIDYDAYFVPTHIFYKLNLVLWTSPMKRLVF